MPFEQKRKNRVNIKKYVKTAKGWNFAAMIEERGKIKWDWCMVGGNAEHHTEGTYYIEWYDQDGKRQQKPVGKIVSEVLEAARLRSAVLDAQDAGIAVADPVELAKRETLSDSIATYLRDKGMNRGKSTVAHYELALNEFKKSVKKATVLEIDRRDMMDFMAHLYKLGLSPRTVNHKLIVALCFLRSCGITDKLLNKDDWPRFTEPERAKYTPEELGQFFAACDAEEYDVFQFFLQTGFRAGEVRHAEYADIDGTRKTIRVIEKLKYNFHPKGKEVRIVPVPDALLRLLDARRKAATNKTGLIFPTKPHPYQNYLHGGGKPNANFLIMCKEIALRAKLNCGECINPQGECCAVEPCCGRWFLHKFRHTFATFHLRSGVDIMTVSRWLGHKDVKTTMIYLEADGSNEVRDKINNGMLATIFARRKSSAKVIAIG